MPGAAGQDDDARAAGPEALDGLLLVVAQVPVRLVELDRVRLAVDVAGEVLGRPADLQQRLLEPAALGGVDDRPSPRRCGRRASGATRFERMTSSSTARSDVVQHQAVHRVVGQGEPAEAVHRVGDVDQQRVRHRVAGEAHQRVDDLLGVVPGGAGVPQRQRRHPVGVHVLGGALQLGERRDRRPAVLRQRVVDLEQQGLVRLDDQRAVAHEWRSSSVEGPSSAGARTRGTLHGNRGRTDRDFPRAALRPSRSGAAGGGVAARALEQHLVRRPASRPRRTARTRPCTAARPGRGPRW